MNVKYAVWNFEENWDSAAQLFWRDRNMFGKITILPIWLFVFWVLTFCFVVDLGSNKKPGEWL